MQELSSALLSLVENSDFVSYQKRKDHNRNSYIQSESFKENFPQWNIPDACSSTQGAPSLVPTCSEVCMGSNIWESGHSRRIGLLLKRIETALDAMQLLFRRKPKEPDGEEELERRHTRSVEFISRFSRNYLFQLRMQVMELKRQLQHMSLASPGKHSQRQILLKKLITTHQTAVQGLQACLNQLPGSSYDPAILSKLDQLLCYVCELTSLKNHIDMNMFSIGSEDSPRQNNIKTKAENLLVIVRRKKKDTEEAYRAWKQTAGSLARKRFGLPTTAKAKIATRSNTKQEKKLSDKAERRGRKQRPGKNQGTSAIRTTLQGGDCERIPNHVNTFDQLDHKIDVYTAPPLDPATALELKISMSRMKDILRGAHFKPHPPPEPTYPPNVGLVFITHEEVPANAEESREERDQKNDCYPEIHIQEEKCTNKPTGNEESSLTNKPDSDEAFRSNLSFDSGGLVNVNWTETTQNEGTTESDLQPRVYCTSKHQTLAEPPDNLLIQKIDFQKKNKKEEKRTFTSNTRLQRKLTSEEQRIIKYRNRFLSYKERVRDILHISEQLLSTVFREVATELEPSILLDKMYHLELQ